jgi:fructokinase
MCNDDANDNRFYEELGRFPSIEEDEPPYRLLCNEYPPCGGRGKGMSGQSTVTGKKYDVVAWGEALIDLPKAGRSPSGMRLFEQNPGGAPANLLSALSRLGAKNCLYRQSGQDMHGRFLRTTLEEVGIDARGLIMAEDVFTTMAFVSLNGGEREFSFARKPGADTCLTAEELNLGVLDHTAVLHIGSLSMTDEPARTATYTAVQRAKEAGAIISYDPNYRASLWSSREEAILRMRESLPLVDVMKLSDEETECSAVIVTRKSGKRAK